MADNGKLTKRQRQALDALMRLGTVRAAAADTGIGERTLYRWTSGDTAFRAELRQRQASMLDETSRALSQLALGAVTAYARALKSDDERVRLRAADSVMTNLLRVRELVEFEERLAELERAVGDAS